jgi:hypothetical protein
MTYGWGIQLKIRCDHGHYRFYEEQMGDLSRFATRFDVELVPEDDFYTFAPIKEAKNYVLAGGLYLNVPCINTYAGNKWDIMRQNNIVFDFVLGTGRIIDTVTDFVTFKRSSKYYISQGLVPSGSFIAIGTRLVSYTCHLNFNALKFYYSEVEVD